MPPRQPEYPGQVLTDLRNPSLVSFIDAARWISASIVFLGHLRNPLFFGFGDVARAQRNALVDGWYFVTGFHAEAVLVFFVLSGYLVGGSAAGRAHLGRFGQLDYFIDRCTRIFLPFIPALLLTAGVDWVGMHYFGGAGLYTGDQAMIREKISSGAFAATYRPDIFLMNILMLQTIVTEPFGSNQPLWTISLEFWFYIVFGIALVARLAWPARAAYFWLAGLAALVLFLGADFLMYLGLWLVGVVVAFIPWRSAERPIIAALVLILGLIFVRLGLNGFKEDALIRNAKNFVVAIAFGWLLLSMRNTRSAPLLAIAPFNEFMAKFSYSLYLIHFPLMFFILSVLYATGRFPGVATGYAPTDWRGLAIYGLIIACVYGSAWSFAQVTENRTGRVRRAIKKYIAGPKHATDPAA